MKKIPAARFKAQCLALMDEVQESGESVLITKRGKPVVKIVPVQDKSEDILGYLVGKARIVGDVMHSTSAEDWEAR